MTNKLLSSALYHRNGFVRKGAVALLRVPRWVAARRAAEADYTGRPPVLANSFPKSGTHLLAQIVAGLPGRVNYGAFLGSETSSFQLRQRSPENAGRFIASFVPGEIIRGHLYYHPQNAADLARKNVVHYFIYRDPRDVVVSEAHYLREMNRWHRLHPYFRKLGTTEEAIALSVGGFDPPIPGIEYPSIAARFARYEGWLASDDCQCIRFEDLQAERRDAVLRRMAEFYAARCPGGNDIEAYVQAMSVCIAPTRSHTFRSGKKAGWKAEFTPELSRRFDEVAGDLLIRLGYEQDHSWVDRAAATA
jgi:Sulfotransferase domain